MSHLRIPSPAPAENTTCRSLLFELQKIWDEIGESDNERDKMLLQLEQECLDVYRRKVDHASKYKAELHQLLADAEAEAANLVAALGERALNAWSEKPKGTLEEQISIIKPVLEDLRRRREERVKEFSDVQSHIVRICAEIAGNTQLSNTTDSQVDERDLTVKKLGELKSHLQELLKEKNLRLQKVDGQLNSIHELSTVMLIDFYEIMSEIHPSLVDSTKSKSISNDTLARLAGKVHSLKQEKQQRLQKIQELGSTLIELWSLMDMPLDEQKRFDRVTCLISAPVDVVSGQGYLALDVIEQTEIEVGRLNILKASKMKELILKKQNELEEIYKAVHIDVDSDTARQILLSLIDSGNVDLSELLGGMDDQITKAKEQALSRKEILDKVEKWRFACEEESWLDDYEMDQNRYSAGRGVHKNLKRAEKARLLVNKIPSLVENLRGKVRAWEEEKRMPFLYDKVPLLETLEEYTVLRQEREEEKRRSREQKRLQEQLATEQETLFGSKPSPLRLLNMKKQSIQGANAGTPTGRRVSTPTPRHGVLAGKERKDGGRTAMVIPVNYVALPKVDSLSRNNSELVSP
eukprot:TRINITY_DN19864_c0_g2_i1.p1 TRINITY_DN19864_c0_g2~~TRINITY_DN19864_c0_g2_i1.p1  ORF type:complete len:579 (+),score=161.03 TRINITY_DN19864_c0_g2_i1:201-1937(+)